jgi:hypothetical protein
MFRKVRDSLLVQTRNAHERFTSGSPSVRRDFFFVAGK